MKIGIVVDGIAEYRSLAELYPEMGARSGNQFLPPLHADIQPYAPVGTIAKQCSGRVSQLLGRDADRVIVLIDRETRPECAGEFSQAIEAKLDIGATCVVVKDRMFENWIIADVAALRKMTARFAVSKAMERAVQPGKADHVDALTLLKRAANKTAYDKVKDSKTVLAAADLATMGLHSRSFRRFLRCAGDPDYGDQSKAPAARSRTPAR